MSFKKYASEEYVNEEILKARSDWNQNDETAVDYIKNRTHWKEYNGPTEVFILPETNLTFSNGASPLTTTVLPIESGATYTVNWNGTSSEHVAQTVDVDGIPCVAIGNHGAMLGTGDTGEPFLVLALPPEYIDQIGFGSMAYALDGSASATLSISIIDDGVVTHHLDPTYIKDMYYTERVEEFGDFLPETVLNSGIIRTKIGLVPGDTYTVIWNGVEYECVAQSFVDSGQVYIAVGDLYTATEGVVGTAATGEPFLITEYSASRAMQTGIYAEVIPLDGSTNVTISIKGNKITETIHKIDKKYLPSFIAKNIVDGTSIGSLRTSGSYIEDSDEYIMGDYAFAEGHKSKASGYASHAEGSYSTASGDYSHAEGTRTDAGGNSSHAEGSYSTASGDYSHAEGYNTTASGDYSHAEGNNTTASGKYSSHAEGSYSTASGDYSHAEGYKTTANSKSQHVQGEYNIVDTEGDESTRGTYAHIVGNGTSSSARSNAHTLDWSGNAWFAGDVYVGSTSGTNKDNGSVKLQKAITGTSGQIVGFDADGNAIAQDMPTSLPTVTTEDAGKVLRVSSDGTWIAESIPSATGVSF